MSLIGVFARPWNGCLVEWKPEKLWLRKHDPHENLHRFRVPSNMGKVDKNSDDITFQIMLSLWKMVI